MNNNQSFNDAIKIAGIIVPIITAIIGLASAVIGAKQENLEFFANLSSNGSADASNGADQNPGTE